MLQDSLPCNGPGGWDQVRSLLNGNLKKHLAKVLPRHPISEAYDYAVFPPGKLFRPLLSVLLCQDLQHETKGPLSRLADPWQPLSLWASFLELHHAYTLVHDDLPCMDNDPVRRNKPSTHIRYGDWRALLVGDGLLNASYQLLAAIDSPFTQRLFRLATWALGPKGLIQGQVLDLSQEMRLTFPQLLETHKFKTARLMQLSLLGSYLLTSPGASRDYRTALDLGKLGLDLGLTFQFIDDLQDLLQETVPLHEREINPFLHFPRETVEALLLAERRLLARLKKYNLHHLEAFLNEHLHKMKLELKENGHRLRRNFPPEEGTPDLRPVESFLQTLR